MYVNTGIMLYLYLIVFYMDLNSLRKFLVQKKTNKWKTVLDEISEGLLVNSSFSHLKELIWISVGINNTGWWSFMKSSAHWLTGWLVSEAPAQAVGPSHVWEKKKPMSSSDTPFMSDGAWGGCRAGEEMAERGSSSRKRGRGVKWRQVFHDKPYNPPPLLYFSCSSSLLQLVHREYSKLAHKQTLVGHFPLFL